MSKPNSKVSQKNSATIDRREFLTTTGLATGAFVLGFWVPPKTADAAIIAGAPWYEEPEVQEINAWIVIDPDDMVTIRIAQTELGQGVWTSNAMMVCEELQCDWSKVQPQYASANRDARESAPEWTLDVMGDGAFDPIGGGEPLFRGREPVRGIPDSLYRRMRTNEASSVRDGRYYLQLAGAEVRERLLLAAAGQWGVPASELTAKDSVITHQQSSRTTTYGQVAYLATETPHPNPETINIKPPSEWTLMGKEQNNLDVPAKVTGELVYGIDVRMPGMKWAAVRACPVYGGDVKSYDFDAVRDQPGVQSAQQLPIPDPSLLRGRQFSGAVAVVADSWYQAKTALDQMPIEWDIPPQSATSNTADMHQELMDAMDQPGTVRVDEGNVDAATVSADKIVEATYSTPYLPRARMEPGNATALVTDGRVDIWLGDQSPQETRRSASVITGIPEENVYIHLCHLGGGFGRNGNGPQAEQTIMIANANRGTPIHLLWTREEDFVGTTYRAMGVARLRAGLDADGWPVALEVRTGMQEDGFGPTSSFNDTSRYYVPNYRFTNHMTQFHIPCGTRRGVGQAAHEFYRETFIDELARTAGKDPYLYRRELIARTDLPHRDDMIRALDMVAEMSDWGSPLPEGKARAIALEEKGAEASGTATISAMVHTVSVSREGVVRLDRVDVALDQGFSLINPLSVKKQLEGQIVWFYNDAMHQANTVLNGRIVENNFDRFSVSRIKEDPPEINIQFFETGHWMRGMGHDRATSVQSGIGDAIFQITGKRFRDLPFSQHDLSWG
ncbi:MAG: xanthine dehydrogenase family protein molybdopterin-binding subunit [Proteobacteria bacterium]|jgi:isoquinoline 1-oxidoreductase subunit beta|nr:xanthine dehydrogenase family protein molybdopterin-binding subunit [Pseudomonadota bacterium]